jgi:hypothetical protein
MPQSKVKKADFERRLDAQVDSVNRLHAGYPTTHRRIRKTISKFAVHAREETERIGMPERELTAGERVAHDEARAAFDRMPRRK